MGNNWRPAIDTARVDWRARLQNDKRQRIIHKIMEILTRLLPFHGGEEMQQQIRKVAVGFEEKIYNAATSQSDYMTKISSKMATLESNFHNTIANSLPSNSAGTSKNTANTAAAPQRPQSSSIFTVTQAQSSPLPTEQPIDRLLRVVRSMSHEALVASVRDMDSVLQLADRRAGQLTCVTGSRFSVGEDLSATIWEQQMLYGSGSSQTMNRDFYASSSVPSASFQSKISSDSASRHALVEISDEDVDVAFAGDGP